MLLTLRQGPVGGAGLVQASGSVNAERLDRAVARCSVVQRQEIGATAVPRTPLMQNDEEAQGRLGVDGSALGRRILAGGEAPWQQMN